MNLRISEQQLRFRITQGELIVLLRGEMVQVALDLGAQAMMYCLSTGNSAEPLTLAIEQGVWHLVVDRATLAVLASHLPSREGIEHETLLGTTPIMLMLEVDVRRKQKS